MSTRGHHRSRSKRKPKGTKKRRRSLERALRADAVEPAAAENGSAGPGA